MYSSAQQKFINFCVMTGHVNSSGSPFPATEWTLCLFATFLTASLRHTSIKVYLSAVRSLPVDQGFLDPLENCLWLQRVVRGIKRSQGSLPANPRLPISSNILRIIHSALDLHSFDDHMFWAACLMAYFGFLRSAEFTVLCLPAFDLSRHLSVRDIAVDVPLNQSCAQIWVKASKTNPFRKGCSILIGPGSPSLSTAQADGVKHRNENEHSSSWNPLGEKTNYTYTDKRKKCNLLFRAWLGYFYITFTFIA